MKALRYVLPTALLLQTAGFPPFAGGPAHASLLAQEPSAGQDAPAQTPAPPQIDRTGDVPESLAPHEPVRPRGDKERARIEAAARFANGQILEKRGQYQQAMQEFQKALAADPDAVEVYRSMILLAVRFNQTRQAQQLIEEALKRAPNDVQMLQLLGAIHKSNRRIPDSIEVLERAAQSPEIDRKSQTYVLLMVELGILYRSTGETAKAADAYEVLFDAVQRPDFYSLDDRALSLLRSTPEFSFERIGSVFIAADRFDKALEAFQLASKSPQLKPEEIAFFKARIYVEQQKYDQALQELRGYLDKKLQSQGSAPYLLLTKILDGLERSAEIEAELLKLYEADPQNNYILYALADYYKGQEQFDKAENHYLKAIGKGADPEGYQGLMAIYHAQGKAADWLGALSGLLGLGRDVEGIEDQFKQVSADAKFMDSIVQEANRLHETGSRKFGFPEAYIIARLAAAEKRTEDVRHFYIMAMGYRQAQVAQLRQELSQYLLEQEEYQLVVDMMEEALKSAADVQSRNLYSERLAQALLPLSFDLEEQGKTEAALQMIQRADEVLPNNPIISYQIGRLQYRTGKWDEAIASFERLIERFQSVRSEQLQNLVRQTHFLLSNIYVQQGNMRKGEEVLERVYAQDPDDPSVNNDLGYLYADQNKKLEQAESMIRKALTAEPENRAYLDSMGWVLYRRGKYEEARKYMDQALEKTENGDATLWDHLGDILDKLNLKDEARDAWQKALRDAEQDERRDDKLIATIRKKLGLPVDEPPVEAPKPAATAP